MSLPFHARNRHGSYLFRHGTEMHRQIYCKQLPWLHKVFAAVQYSCCSFVVKFLRFACMEELSSSHSAVMTVYLLLAPSQATAVDMLEI